MNSLSIQRFLSMRDRHGLAKLPGKGKSTAAATTTVSQTPSKNFYGLFNAGGKLADAQEEQKLRELRKLVAERNSISLQDSHLLYALRSLYASGNVDKAFELLVAISNSWEGLVMDYDPSVKLLGAENRKGVTCFLDSILFAIFSRLDSFEAMLYNSFEDTTRNKLGMLLRLWVNLLRSGRLITMDITQLLQESLAECGWKEAAELQQQDASEAFTFITEKLELPLLTLKMDIYHTGREDATDDHKFINERLLEVAIPSDPESSESTISLEDCLEAYFNNRIEVKRYLEQRSISNPTSSHDAPGSNSKKGSAVHVESVELVADSACQSPASYKCVSVGSPMRNRAPSIVQQRFIPDEPGPCRTPVYEQDLKGTCGRLRSGSFRKEVMMPAWQFFSLIPWYTENTPENDAQVAAHFSSKRPILGICLKRYTFTDNGKAARLSTRIDVPTEIGLPHFISDDSLDEDGPIYGNFKLSLQSVVCHRGNSVDSGHYISLVKGTNSSIEIETGSNSESMPDTSHWMRFDDMAPQRITLVDITRALKDEAPYLLFYQIVPIYSNPIPAADRETLPSCAPSEPHDSGIAGRSTTSSHLRGSSDRIPVASRSSLEITAPDDVFRGRSTMRKEWTQSVTVSAELTIPDPESSQSSSSRRGSKHSKAGLQSRPPSQTGERFTAALSKMAKRKSKEAGPATGSDNTVEAKALTTELGPDASFAEDEKVKRSALRREGKQERSKIRLNRVSNMAGKGRGAKPERECSIM